LWARPPVGAARLLAGGETDCDGRFELPIGGNGRGAPARLELRLFETSFRFGADRRPEAAGRRRIATLPLDGRGGGATLDCGERRVRYWLYDPDTRLVRVKIDDLRDPPDPYTAERWTAQKRCVGGFNGIQFRARKHQVLNLLNPRWPPLPAIHADYPENRTRALERERPGYTRSDEYFGQRVLSGFNPCLLAGDRERPGRWRYWYNWDAYEQDGVHELPNVDVRFEVRDERLWPVRITVQRRLPGGTAPRSPLAEPVTATPEDGERWLAAKRIFRVCSGVGGEIDFHLARTHLNSEQYAIAARRNLRKNPLRHLLFPHLREVTRVNVDGNTLVFGRTGVLNVASALTPESVIDRFVDQMASLDWTGWRPRRPLCATHHYAKAANLFWEVVTAYVEVFFAERGPGIVARWPEVHRFSRDLVAHSLPYAPLPSDPGDEWIDRNELDDPGVPRQEVGGVLRAVRPVTRGDEPAPGDLENLKQLCRYAIFHASFGHAWSNSRQYDEGGEVLYASLGLRNGAFGPESDLSIAPTPREAAYQMFLARFLSGNRYGMIMANTEGDIHPVLLELLRSREEEFRSCEVDIYDVQARVNI
ncbi:MAG TPA: hypothetical protein VF121_12630, partial [Thermoanaerobaculia bacterium]|nr:hypothetical protein [Thermoanaerobaculia bacterium]